MEKQELVVVSSNAATRFLSLAQKHKLLSCNNNFVESDDNAQIIKSILSTLTYDKEYELDMYCFELVSKVFDAGLCAGASKVISTNEDKQDKSKIADFILRQYIKTSSQNYIAFTENISKELSAIMEPYWEKDNSNSIIISTLEELFSIGFAAAKTAI